MMKQKLKMTASLMLTALFVLPMIMKGQDSTKMKIRTFQAGFITPLSSNGLDSWNVINQFSINLLAGYAGGINGVEFSGLGSVLQGNMRGAQFTGLGNIVLKETKGAQFSGLFNIGLGDTKAAQFAGLVNVNAGKFKGFQTSGLANINSDSTKGFQLTGLFNYSPGLKVTQVSGFLNVVPGNNKGFQLAGFSNITSGRVSGTQVAGFFNYAGKLQGVELGVFNYIDSLENGVPIGFLSFVKNGYTAFEAGSTETLFGVMSFKTGTRKFYNILSVGGGSRNGLSLFAWGYGLGAFFPVGKKAGISIDGTCYHVNEGEWFTDRLNLLNKLNVTASWSIANHAAFFGGISWNVTVSDITDEYGDPVVSNIAPWSVFDETYNDHLNVLMYPGISGGIRF
jgi:hypothetical protein